MDLTSREHDVLYRIKRFLAAARKRIVLVAAVFIGLFLLILGGKAVVTADMPLFKIINTHHTAFLISQNIRNWFSAALAEGAFSLLFSHPTIVSRSLYRASSDLRTFPLWALP
jgi:hypothetical protein